MSVMNLVSLAGGLGLFLFGMNIMGDGLERTAGSRLRKLLQAVTHNRVLALLVGVVITILVQSSSATTVMVVGFVNAQLITLTQAIGVIMGANIGTTATSLMLSFDMNFGHLFAAIGLLMSVLPKRMEGLRKFAPIVTGVGILFIGMNIMSEAMKPLREWQGFLDAITAISTSPLSPVLGVLIGAGLTAILQSSAASIGILQALAATGAIDLRLSMFILFGQNIGTCITALIACAGTNKTAKRAAVVHLLFNVIGAVLFTVLTVLLPLDRWIIALAGSNLKLQISMVHIVFNIVTTLLLLPTASLLEKVAWLVVPGVEARQENLRLKYFDDRLLNTPPIAVAQLFNEVQRMGDIALQNFDDAMLCFSDWDEAKAKSVEENEEVLDFLNREITAAMVEVKGLSLNEEDMRLLGSLFHVVNDLERVGDHSMNILESAEYKMKEGVKVSNKAYNELMDLAQQVESQLKTAMDLFRRQSDDAAAIARLEEREQDIDDLTDALRIHHMDRLKNKKCTAKNGMLYLDTLTNLERIGDHAENVGTSVSKASA